MLAMMLETVCFPQTQHQSVDKGQKMSLNVMTSDKTPTESEVSSLTKKKLLVQERSKRMIITIIFLSLIVLAIIYGLLIKFTPLGEYVDLDTLFIAILCIGVVGSLFSGIGIYSAQAHTDYEIARQELRYETLYNKYEAVKGKDVGDTTIVMYADIIDEVYEWNMAVLSDRYWYKNPWFNWFYNKDKVEARQFIEMENYE